jgi:tyrosyl-tRNA synthetase
LNVDDEGVEDYLKIYTLMNQEEIAQIMQQFATDRAGRHAQKTLAYEVTKIVHGAERADSVKRISEVLFGAADYSALTTQDYIELSKEVGLFDTNGVTELAELLVLTGLAASKSEARRFITSGAVYVNGVQIASDTSNLDTATLQSGYCVLRRGKNSQTIIHI